MKTFEELLEQSVRALIAQGRGAIDERGACRYDMMTPDGQRVGCAIGVLIEDKDLAASLHGPIKYIGTSIHEWSELGRKQPELFANMAKLAMLQQAHDRAVYDVLRQEADWPTALRNHLELLLPEETAVLVERGIL